MKSLFSSALSAASARTNQRSSGLQDRLVHAEFAENAEEKCYV